MLNKHSSSSSDLCTMQVTVLHLLTIVNQRSALVLNASNVNTNGTQRMAAQIRIIDSSE